MKIFILLVISRLAYGQQTNVEEAINSIFTSDFLNNFEEVSPPPLESLSALEKCGEGSQRNQFVCVPYYNCDPKTNTVRLDPAIDGSTILDIRANDKNRRCDHYLDTCCMVPNDTDTGEDRIFPSPNTNEPTPTTTTTTTTTSSTTTTTTTAASIDNRPQPKSPQFCGVRNSNGIDFQITGNTNNEAQFGEFPWMVAVLRRKDNSIGNAQQAICGGSLITPIVVLTGAHCVANSQAEDIKIRAGEWDTQTEKERIPYQERNVDRIIAHESYSARNLYNDIALLILDRPVAKVESVGTVCIPSQSQRLDTANCIVTGWGKNEFGNQGRYSVILKKIQLPLVQNNNCQRALRTTRLGGKFVLHRSFICAGGERGVDACTGDGGSPLVCPDANNPDRYYQVGIVAWGIGCGENQVPGVYSDVSQFRNWIDTRLQEAGININAYVL